MTSAPPSTSAGTASSVASTLGKPVVTKATRPVRPSRLRRSKVEFEAAGHETANPIITCRKLNRKWAMMLGTIEPV